MKRRSRSSLAATAAVAATLLVSGCLSQPSARTVARDVVDGMAEAGRITEAERDCMFDRLDDYTQDEVQAIGEANEGNAPDDPGNEDLQRFEADLASCMSES